MAQAAGAAQAGVVTTTTEGDLLGQLLTATKAKSDTEREKNKKFIEAVVKEALKSGRTASGDAVRSIKSWISEIDQKMSAQVNAILHHPDFQKLEGTWRGLKYLVDNSELGVGLKIKIFNVTRRELIKDFEDQAEFDQSALFKKVYEQEYGQLGGQPYGLLVGDFEFGNHPTEDIGLLKKIAGVAATASAPFVAAASHEMFKLDSFADLNTPIDLARIFDSDDYAGWRSFRESEDSRYVALTMPRVLARLPYGANTKRIEAFEFEESVDGKDHSKYLWMNSAWAYAARVTNAYSVDGWFMRTRGVEGGGKVENLPVHTFVEDGGVTMKCPTEVLIPDRRENELSNLGFLPLLHCKGSDFAAFLGAQSCQKPKKYFDDRANASAEMSTKFNYLLCVSRFSHYLKVMGRNWIGKMTTTEMLQKKLNDWINNYVVADPSIVGEEIMAQRPLQEARIDVAPVPGKPGWFQTVAYLKPHFQLEGFDCSMRLVAEIPPPKK